jgi:hypothetical protein
MAHQNTSGTGSRRDGQRQAHQRDTFNRNVSDLITSTDMCSADPSVDLRSDPKGGVKKPLRQ